MPRVDRIVAVDIDGVLADTHTEWLRRYNHEYADDLTPDMITDWKIEKFIKSECSPERFYSYLSELDFYDNVKPLRSARVGVDILREMGYIVIFATRISRKSTDTKLDWLFKWGFLVDDNYPRDFAAISDKQRLNAHYLIDDCLDVCQEHSGGIVFDQPWNRTDTIGCHRLYGWGQAHLLMRSL